MEQVLCESPMTSFSIRTVSGGVLAAEMKSRFGMLSSRRRNFQSFPNVPVEGIGSSGKEEDVPEGCDGEEMPIEGDEDGEDGEVAQYQDDDVVVSEELAVVAAAAAAELRTTALVDDR